MLKKFILSLLILTSLTSLTISPVNIKASTNIEASSVNSDLSTQELDWYIVPNENHTTPEPNKTGMPILEKYSGYYVGDTEKKVLYLTFDEGYENGYTPKILDILKTYNVPSAFFVVKPYIKSNKDLILRMVNEGHLVCNHSSTHPSMAKVLDLEKFKKEFSDVEEEYKKLTNQDIPKYFRPPMGKFSEYSMKNTNDLGYKSIFWSLAYKDFDVNKQPEKNAAKEKILSRIHNGAILLLHAVSKTNTEILEELILQLKSDGYEFRPLTDF